MGIVLEALMDLLGDLVGFVIPVFIPLILVGTFGKPLLRFVPGTEELRGRIGVALDWLRGVTVAVMIACFAVAMIWLYFEAREMQAS
jgi:hypothetical protein